MTNKFQHRMMVGAQTTSKPEFKISRHRLRSAVGPAMFILLALLVTPAFAKHSSASYHLWKDPAATAYSHDGLPCSTATVAQSLISRSSASLRELDQIEHARLTAVGAASQRKNDSQSNAYRPAAPRGGAKGPAINFVYHAPLASGSRTRGR
jgi:hypothetical protein